MSSSLLDCVRKRILDAIRSVQPEPPNKWKAMVVDEHSKRVLHNVLKSTDILEENVTAIFLNSDRHYEPHPHEEAMYLLTPTTRNIDRIIEEYSDGRQQFKRCHLFFTDSLSEEFFGKLTNSPAMPFLACVTELYINYWPLEPRVFSIEAPEMFFTFFAPPRTPKDVPVMKDRLMEDLQFAARQIANCCISMEEMPYIRFYQPQHHPPLGPFAPAQNALPAPPKVQEGSGRWRTNLAKGAVAREFEYTESESALRVLARLVQQALDDHQRINPEFPKRERGRPRGTLILTDRSMDTVAPFLHEMTYQAMSNDLLDIRNGGKYTHAIKNAAGREDVNEVTLNDEDRLWVKLRHMHMKDAIDLIMADFKEFASKNASFQGDGPTNMDTMRDMMAGMNKYQGDNALFSLHLSLFHKCMELFDNKKLPPHATVSSLTNIEQCCATGMTPEGKTPKTLVEEMVPVLDSREVSNWNKLRIIALYIQYREGVPEEDKRRLCQHARLSMSDVDALNSLAHLGVRLTRGPGDKDIKKKIKARPKPGEIHDFSRFNPVLETVIDDQVSGKLDQSTFPYFRDSPAITNTVTTPVHSPPTTTSLRSTRPTWHKAPTPGGPTAPSEVRPRLLLFIAGGMTYSEMRTVYLRSDPTRHDIFLGSTHALTPKDFMDDLKVLEIGGVGSRVAQNGVGECVGSAQRYFDKRFPQPNLEMLPPVRVNSAPAAGKSGWGLNKHGGRADGGISMSSGGMLSPGMSAPPLQQTQSMTSFDSGGTTKSSKKKFGLFKKK